MTQLTAWDEQTALTIENVERLQKVVDILSNHLQGRPDKVIVKGKQLLEFRDWQFLGINFGITARIDQTEELNIFDEDRIKFMGFKATASAVKNGEVLSTAIMRCTRNEPQWKDKPRFQLESMAQTRACRKVLQNLLRWVFDQAPAGQDLDLETSPDELDGKLI